MTRPRSRAAAPSSRTAGRAGLRAAWVAVALGLAAPSTSAPPSDEAALVARPPNLVLVTLDTTRADALSCYGQVPGLLRPREGVTPNLDALAAGGVRFDSAWAHAPTTLSSHASMLTGLDPHGHAIPRNGFPLPAALPTVTERLAAAGYDTRAVVAALALEKAMGLDRGFDSYDDRMTVKLGPMVQDRAEGVTARALESLAAWSGAEPLFLWVHYYDPHQPYLAPGAWLDRFADPAYAGPFTDRHRKPGRLRGPLRDGAADPADVDHVAARYLGEVAYMDHHVGLLLDALRERGVLDHAVVVVAGDHGEVLSEDPRFAYTHGNDVGDGVSRVPLLVRGYGVPLAERAVVRSQVALSGLAPTLEQLAGLPPTLGDGVPFYDLLRPGPVRDEDGWPERSTVPVFLEATRPHVAGETGWNNARMLRGVRAGGFVLRAAPRQGRSSLDAGPTGAVLPGDEGVHGVLAALLDRWDAQAPAFREEVLSPETEEALRALGYIDDDEGGGDTK